MKTVKEASGVKERNLVIEHNRKQMVLFGLFILLAILAMT
jgi:hypothetical protein